MEKTKRKHGYVTRTLGEGNIIEQFFFDPENVYGPYEKVASVIDKINFYYLNQIYKPLFSAICRYFNLDFEKCFGELSNLYKTLVFQYYPRNLQDNSALRLNAHKDFGIATLLYFEEPGLEAKVQNRWYPIVPIEHHIVVNFGNALEQVTAGKCHSPVHQVRNTTPGRLSMVYFIDHNRDEPVVNCFDNSMIADSGEEFFKKQFSEFYSIEY